MSARMESKQFKFSLFADTGCTKKNYRTKYPQLRCPYKMYFTNEVTMIEITGMNSLDEYFFKYTVETYKEIYGVWN